ncbi:hypothetical protein QOZ80_2BG0170410 [Eleusine coracana subsp. coracana]|nr:hypothetical protein QOZ80_2BG0170410 [Eleusine coracana subsp. coracana]
MATQEEAEDKVHAYSCPAKVGNHVPIDQVREDVASAYEKDVECQAQNMLLVYKSMCDKKVEAEVLVVKGDDVANTISGVVSACQINKLVVGVSSQGKLVRKSKGARTSSRICKSVPSFCTVYAVSKGGLSMVYSPVSESGNSSEIFQFNESSNTGHHSDDRSSVSDNTPSRTSGSNLSGDNLDSSSLADHNRPRSLHEYLTGSSLASSILDKNQTSSPCAKGQIAGSSNLPISDKAPTLSNALQELMLSVDKAIAPCASDHIPGTSNFPFLDKAPTGPIQLQELMLLEDKDDVNTELEKLRLKLGHIKGVQKLVHADSTSAAQQISELTERRAGEEARLMEVHSRINTAIEEARQVREHRQALEEQAKHLRDLTNQEALKKKNLQLRTAREAASLRDLEKLLEWGSKSHSTFTWEDMESATSSFSEALKIGSGSVGTVYKGNIHQTTVAIKVLNSNDRHITKHFKQELEVLGKIRHQHLLLLLGACLDRPCLVYEYMENGSLEDRLQCKGGTSPLPWNFTSKIGDAGLATLLPSRDVSSTRTIYKDTDLVGTLFYMDPEYQRTGQVSSKSDTYALGMVLLQLLTAKPPVGLADIVERAVEEDRLVDILDERAGMWPVQEAHDLARLGLSCLEMRSRDRPDLEGNVLIELERLNNIVSTIFDQVQPLPTQPPNHFICPILKRVMQDPCIASDGYSYDRAGIEMWLCENEVSPLTKLGLPNKDLIPNYALLSAINNWKAKAGGDGAH